MVGDGLSKGQSQRKRRQERDSCINNIKLNLNLTPSSKDCVHNRRPPPNSTYTKKPKPKHIVGSLENVSTNPWGEVQLEGQSSLRRSRSLAISRENLFSSLDFPTSGPNKSQRRSQLIPRAKLIDRRVDNRYKVSSVENLDGCGRTVIKRKSPQTPPDYSGLDDSPLKNRQQAQLEGIYYYPSDNNSIVEENINNQLDSLDSNYRKSSINSAFQLSYEDFPGLSLPNYYPDSKYDTDNTDNISLTDNISSVSLDRNNNPKPKYSSCDNIPAGNWEIIEQDSIPYDENILLSPRKPLYKTLTETHYSKPRTIRGPTPYTENYFYSKNQAIYSSLNSNSDKLSSIETETDCNLDVITKTNEQAEAFPVTDPSNNNTLCSYSNIENNPLYGQLETSDKLEKNELVEGNKESLNETIKTYIEVAACEETVQKLEDTEQFKTVVAVETSTEPESKCKYTQKDTKQHSHNYLKEFLETQKGSRKPLQNFIAKKFSNLSRRNSKEITPTNLAENQFHSLPDITVSKNLRKCEKIDRKLRKCEKTNLAKTKSESTESRFIVNIGRHFDVTANSSIPVDFEVKISKVPKKNKDNGKGDEQLIEAVKNLKETLHGSNNNLTDNLTKPEIVGVQTKPTKTDEMESNSECTKEYQEKLGTMRNYWNKLGNANTEETPTCKIVDVQTKVEDVKKKFEPQEPNELKPNKVQLAKKLFEQKQPQEKLSPFVKESCSYFESDNQFESLNPNIVEIINKNEVNSSEKSPKATAPIPKKRTHKPISKSKSITYPEFDHVRYRVVKSDLFQKKIFANCEKESQFDGLMQYLQDYSFQELLIDNNIVIIEPIRTKIPYEKSASPRKTPKNVTPLLHKLQSEESNDSKDRLKRHFFYHPIRVNKEVNDDELPNPDTVRQARQFFEGGLKRSLSSQELEGSKEKFTGKGVDPDKDRCSATDTSSHSSNISYFDSQENLYDFYTNDHCCNQQYVSEDILEKIRECGTTVTYYGGRVVKQQVGQPILTKAIMEEIRNNERRCNECTCRKNGEGDTYQGVKFRLVKSNSCSSRLELVGTENLKDSRTRFLAKQKQLLQEHKKEENNNCITELNEAESEVETKHAINECIKKQSKTKESQPKIIGEERKVRENKMTQWGDVNKAKTYSSINFNEKSSQKINYDYHNYDKLKMKNKTISDMEFEPYEVA